MIVSGQNSLASASTEIHKGTWASFSSVSAHCFIGSPNKYNKYIICFLDLQKIREGQFNRKGSVNRHPEKYERWEMENW